MAFKSDAHRKFWFANRDNLSHSEGSSYNVPTRVGFDAQTKKRLQREEDLILELQNNRSKGK